MKKLENNFLYLVVLGGRAKKANIELHDVRWFIVSKIEEHIDSYKKIHRRLQDKFNNL